MQAAVDAGALHRHLEWFSHVPRDTGGDGEDRAAAYLAAELEAAGVPGRRCTSSTRFSAIRARQSFAR